MMAWMTRPLFDEDDLQEWARINPSVMWSFAHSPEQTHYAYTNAPGAFKSDERGTWRVELRRMR